ncbi:MAG: prepilin peptidase [Olegusella sp.]|nr:prepilin peptidase [Olegusella sp.]
METGLAIYLTCVTALFGLVMGSFLNCVAWRIVQGESWVSGRSHCDTCGHVLEPRDLVPVVSWLSTHGRCRYCGAKVSARNPATEIGCAILYVVISWHYGLTLAAVEMCGLASVLLVASLTDLDDYLIPNGCVAAAVVIRAVYLAVCALLGQDVGPLVRESLIGAVAVTVPLLVLVLIMDRVLGKPSMGGGDLKLFAVAGLYFGWQQCLFLIIVACLLGIVFALVGRYWFKTDDGDVGAHPDGDAPADGDAIKQIVSADAEDDVPEHAFPFGPSIAAAMVITMLCGHKVLAWYLGLLL